MLVLVLVLVLDRQPKPPPVNLPGRTSRPGTLAEPLTPKHPRAAHLLRRLTDTSFLDRYEGKPWGRETTGLVELDRRFQQEVAELIAAGAIAPGILVIDETGHSLPNLARVLDEPGIDAVGTIHFAWNPHQVPRLRPGETPDQAERLMSVSLDAIADHVATFGITIAKHQAAKEKGEPRVLYLALDGERYLDLRTRGWPEARDYLTSGFTRVVVLIERTDRWQYGEQDVAPDLQPYITSLRAEGMAVEVRGIDPRTGAMTTYGRPKAAQPGGGTRRGFGAIR